MEAGDRWRARARTHHRAARPRERACAARPGKLQERDARRKRTRPSLAGTCAKALADGTSRPTLPRSSHVGVEHVEDSLDLRAKRLEFSNRLLKRGINGAVDRFLVEPLGRAQLPRQRPNAPSHDA